MEIIKSTDIRYNSLPNLWNNLNYSNIIRNEGYRRLFYYIPPELVLTEYRSYYGVKVLKSLDGTGYCNWISCGQFGKLLYTIELDSQSYFDLLVLHINDTNERPRCINCNEILEYSGQVTLGYNQCNNWDVQQNHFCSRGCCVSYQNTHPEEYPIVAERQILWKSSNHTISAKIKAKMSWFLNKGSLSDITVLYGVNTSDGRYKYGITEDLSNRIKIQGMNPVELGDNFIVLFESTRDKVAYLEAHLKLIYSGSEYIELNQVEDLLNNINKLKLNLVNPFE